jgi:hypothetical protein
VQNALEQALGDLSELRLAYYALRALKDGLTPDLDHGLVKGA